MLVPAVFLNKQINGYPVWQLNFQAVQWQDLGYKKSELTLVMVDEIVHGWNQKIASMELQTWYIKLPTADITSISV